MEGSPGKRVLTPSDMLPLKDSESSEKEGPTSPVLVSPGSLLPRRGSWGCSGAEKLLVLSQNSGFQSESPGAFVGNADAWVLQPVILTQEV